MPVLTEEPPRLAPVSRPAALAPVVTATTLGTAFASLSNILDRHAAREHPLDRKTLSAATANPSVYLEYTQEGGVQMFKAASR